ncbi:MAG: M20/M25/M40 family metallo-hydrolase [Planctomycetota bacterium]
MEITSEIIDRVTNGIHPSRLVETATRLIGVQSWTGNAGAVSDCLAELLSSEGFSVERPIGGHDAAPAVVVRWNTGAPGKTLQFDGHLDTVHLPFVPPTVIEGQIRGSGASDMKSGVAVAVEALRVLRDTNVLPGGGILFVAHDLHEAPWGLGEQLDQLIREGIHGDAVLIPEPLCSHLPIAGRGSATWKVTVRRDGAPVHEVMRPGDEPSVIAAGAKLVRRLSRLDRKLSKRQHPLAGSESVFVGQFHGGEIYNQYPQECFLEGTRRWLPGTDRHEVERQFKKLLNKLSRKSGTNVDCDFRFVRDAFLLDLDDPLIHAFQRSYSTISGSELVSGPKLFVDDGNSFWGIANVAAVTHGPRAGGQHTLGEWVDIEDMIRVVKLYVLTAVAYCA